MRYFIADPAGGKVVVDESTFSKSWISSESKEGIALLLEPTPAFYSQSSEEQKSNKGFAFLFNYLKPYQAIFFTARIGYGAG